MHKTPITHKKSEKWQDMHKKLLKEYYFLLKVINNEENKTNHINSLLKMVENFQDKWYSQIDWFDFSIQEFIDFNDEIDERFDLMEKELEKLALKLKAMNVLKKLNF